MSRAQNFAKLDHQPAYRVVSEKIRHAITSGELAAGDLLPTETELADQFGVTRSTLREAIRLLEHGGLIGRADRKRLVVTLPQTDQIGRSVSSAMLMHKVTFRELWEVAMGLEPLAARLACVNASDQEKRELRANWQRSREAVDDHQALLECELEFHNRVAAATHNHALLQARAPLNDLFYPAWGAVIRALSPGERIVVAHRHILEAIEANDPDRAGLWMQKHMEDFRRGIEIAELGFEQPVSGSQ
jgi:DNA-binding FadR family transcriptional regulator